MKAKKLLFFFLGINSITCTAQTLLPNVLSCNTTLTLSQSPYLVQAGTTVPAGCQLTVQPGVEIIMSDTSNFIIRGKAEFLGTAAQPIYIHAENMAWSTIFLDATTDHCKFNHVIIEAGTFKPHPVNLAVPADTALQRAAFSSYYSSVELNNCTFKNNLQCIYSKYGSVSINSCSFDSTNVKEKINIQFVRNALVENCFFSRTFGPYDMLDYDGVNNGIIRNNTMYNAEDDGIDIGEWESKACDTVLITNNFIDKMLLGKGISIGEKSKNIRVERNVIANSAIGIAVKDDATVAITNNTLNADSVGIYCYEKTAGWGGGIAVIKNTIIANSALMSVKTDSLSSATVSYSLSNTDLLTGAGNLFTDPLFVSISAGDYTLQPTSPCIDAGDPASPLDPDLTRNDIGAFYFDSAATGMITFYQFAGNDAFRIYPNPSNGSIIINYYSSAKVCSIKVENIRGQTVYSKEHTSSSGIFDEMIDLKVQARGIYFIHIVTDKKSFSKKVVLN